MQIVCPNCGEPISAENINIQRMVAVCPACHTVFQFELSAAKIKRRKVKQPKQLISDETEHHLKLTFRTNFLLHKNELFLTSAFFSLIFTFVTLLLIGAIGANFKVAFVAAMFGIVTGLFYYGMALIAYNKTHIEVSDENITVSRRPLPDFFSPPNAISLSGIEAFRYEETTASKKEGYETPRYTVWAERVDGHRKAIVSDVIEDYAVFITQRLNERLDSDSLSDDSLRLADDQSADEIKPDTVIAHLQSQTKKDRA